MPLPAGPVRRIEPPPNQRPGPSQVAPWRRILGSRTHHEPQANPQNSNNSHRVLPLHPASLPSLVIHRAIRLKTLTLDGTFTRRGSASTHIRSPAAFYSARPRQPKSKPTKIKPTNIHPAKKRGTPQGPSPIHPGKTTYFAAARTAFACSASAFALSVASHVKSGSVRPKCPYAAVCR